MIVTCLLGQLSTFYSHGTYAAVLLCVGLAIGLVLGKMHARHSSADRPEIKRLVDVLSSIGRLDPWCGR